MSAMATSKWMSDRLKDISAVNARSLPVNTAADFSFRYLEISNVNNYGIISEEAIERIQFADAPSRARRVVTKGDVLVSSVRPNLQAIAHVGRVVDEPLVCSTGFNVVSPRLEKVADRFLYYFLLSEGTRQHFEAVAKGVGYPAIEDKDFCSTVVPLPPVPEQKRIASYLDASCAAIDQAVEAKQKQHDVLDALRKSIVHNAVTQGLNPTAAMKDSGVEWLGPIPKHWKVKKLKRVFANIDYGLSESTEEAGRFAVLKMGNIVRGEITFTKIEFVPDVAPHLVLEKNDLLFNRTNSLDQVAKVGIFRGVRADNITFASYLVRLRANHHNSPFYLNHLLNADIFLGLARKMAIPSVQQANLNPTRYGRLEIPVPPLPEQIAIASYLDARSRQIQEIEKRLYEQINTLKQYRKSLIHECVTGKRRISNADIAKLEAYV